jgi:hypothetical protein
VGCSKARVGGGLGEAVIVNQGRLRYVFLLGSSIGRTDNTYKGVLEYHFWVILGACEGNMGRVVGDQTTL